MKVIRFISIFSLIFAIISVYFGTKFGEMAYWGSGLTWFWIGVFCDCIFGIIAMILVFIKKKDIKLNEADVNIRVLSFTIAFLNICWTTFGVIAGLSGM